MIERFDDDIDMYSVLGRTALLAGGTFGAYKTWKEAPKTIGTGWFKKSLSELEFTSSAPKVRERIAERKEELLKLNKGKGLTHSKLMSNLLNRNFDSGYTKQSIDSVADIKQYIGTGYKGRSAELGPQLERLMNKLGKSAKVDLYYHNGEPVSLGIKGKGIDRIKLPLTTSQNKIMMGQTMSAAGGVFKKNAEGIFTTAVEGMDVAVLRKINETYDDGILSGKYKASEIVEQAIEKTVYESSFGQASRIKTGPIESIRGDVAHLDVFGELTMEEKQRAYSRIAGEKGYGAGSASMAASGKVALPENALSKLPASEASPSLKQLFRETDPTGMQKPFVDWTEGKSGGFTSQKQYTLNDISFKTKSGGEIVVTAQEIMDEVFERLGVAGRELAEEEILVSDELRRAKVKTDIFTHNVDVSEGQTTFTKRLIRDIHAQGAAAGMSPEEVSKAMTSSGGVNGLNLDLNKKLRIIEAREAGLDADIRILKGERSAMAEGLKGLDRTFKERGLPSKPTEARKKLLVELERLKIERDTLDATKGGSRHQKKMRGEALDTTRKRMREIREEVALINEYFKGRGKVTSDLSDISGEMKKANRARGHVRKAISDYGVLGVDNQGRVVRVNAANTDEVIKSLMINPNKGLMTIATETHHGIVKAFGGVKATIARDVQVTAEEAARVAEQVIQDITGIKSGADVSGVGIFSLESRVKMKGGVLPSESLSLGIMQFAETIQAGGDPAEIKKLEKLGIVAGKYKDPGFTAKEWRNVLEETWGGKNFEDVFLGKVSAGGAVSQSLVSFDVAKEHAGTGKLASLSERGFLNVHVQGQNEFLMEVLERSGQQFDAHRQLQELDEADAMVRDFRRKSISSKSIAKDLASVFDPDIERRAKAFAKLGEGQIATIDLGREIEGVRKLPVFATPDMAQYIGEGSDFERSQRNLISAVEKGADDAELSRLARLYKAEQAKLREGVVENLYKVKNIKGSVYGQAAGTTQKLDDFAARVAKEMGMADGITGPAAALAEEDILQMYRDSGMKRKEILRQARAGELWGLVSREPAEVSQRNIFSKIISAEAVGIDTRAAEAGTVWIPGKDVAKNMSRRAMGVDMDRDHVGVIAVLKEKSMEQIRKFYMSGDDVLGQAHKESLKRLGLLYNLKGRAPIDPMKLSQDEIVRIAQEQKRLEKGLIGPFSNEFKKVQVGLRDAMTGSMSQASADALYRANEFHVLFIENVLKGKNQSLEALLGGETDDVLHLIKQTPGTDFAVMDDATRALKMQGMFDKLSFGDEQIAGMVREVGSGQRAVNKELKAAANLKDLTDADFQNFAKYYNEASAIDNVESILKAHSRGTEVLAEGAYLEGTARRVSQGFVGKAKEVMKTVSKISKPALKNVGLWGILPTMAIGAAGTLFSKPKILEPVAETGPIHERDTMYNAGMGQASAGKTMYNIPEQKVSSYDIKGLANYQTSMAKLSNMSQGTSTAIRLQDHRSHMNKYTIEDIMEKGY